MKNSKLVNARKERNLTQQELAELLNVQKSTVSNWENGTSKPTLEKAIGLSTILERNIKDIFQVD